MKTAVNSAVTLGRVRTAGLYLMLAALVACMALPAGAATGRFVANNTPGYVAHAKNLGTVDANQTIEVSIWLNPHNRSQLDALASQLYDRNSPNYRHWLTRSQFATRFAPTAAEAKTVQKFFEAHNMTVVKVGPNNFFVRARGTAGDVENAFHVQLNNYQVNGKTIRANDRDPYVDGDASPLVRSVAGLDSGKYEHPLISRQTALLGGQTPAVNTNPVQPDSNFFSSNCFDGVEKESFSNNNDGSFPIGTFKGNHLNLQTLSSAGCAYTPPAIQTAYNLTGLYAEGFDGTGQTVAIIDWCGSSTIESDANAFAKKFGLPALTPANFGIINIPGPSLCESIDDAEINIDVEWAHAVAPGASINLIVPPSSYFQDIDEAEYITIDSGLGNVISGSYGAPEAFVYASELQNGSLLSEIAAVLGISANFSTGDAGDFSLDFYPPQQTVSYPADSPYSTAIGGVTLALNHDKSIAWQAGWGNNEILLSEAGYIFDPPLSFGFYAGAGGGGSNCAVQDIYGDCLAGFPKPSYQRGHGIAGKYRQLPDVSWLADPFTGVAILISLPGQVPAQVWQVYGGTSVACPMFSALWAIANQEAEAAGGGPLGQAAPYLYSMPAGTIFDIVPVNSATNVRANIQESTTLTNHYSAKDVLGGAGPGHYVSALWDYPYEQYTSLVISFGTDCSAEPPSDFYGTLCTDSDALKTKVGWDNVTGVGTPNGQAFADFFGTAAAVK
ncbi:MAG: S53 family peptidase [Terriglobales bacterium]